MSEKKAEGLLHRKAHTFALGGRAAGVVSVFLLVPFVRRLRAQRHERRHHRFLLGH